DVGNRNECGKPPRDAGQQPDLWRIPLQQSTGDLRRIALPVPLLKDGFCSGMLSVRVARTVPKEISLGRIPKKKLGKITMTRPMSSRRSGLPRRASHRTGLAGLASGSLDRCLRRPDQAGQRLPQEDSLCTRGHIMKSTGSRTTCASDWIRSAVALRRVQQVSLSPGFVPGHTILVPFRAVGECEGQLPWSSASQSISPFAPLAFASFIASMGRSDFSTDVGSSSFPSPTLPPRRICGDLLK